MRRFEPPSLIDFENLMPQQILGTAKLKGKYIFFKELLKKL
jgi:hypothetical protein